MTSVDSAQPSPAPLTAQWVRDGAYLEAAVGLAHADRPAARRAAVPLCMALLVAMVFSPWGILSVLLGWDSLLARAPALLLFLLLLALFAAQTYPAMLQGNARRYAFAGDTACWEASAQGLHYRVVAPDGRVRHEARSHWSWWSALSVGPTGLRLHRPGSVESYAIPVQAWQGGTPDAQARQQAAAVALASSAGVPMRSMQPDDRAGLVGSLLGLAVLLPMWMAVCALLAALPHLRHGNVQALYTSGLDTFWWAGLLLAPGVLALHLALAAWQARRQGGHGVPALAPHLLLALAWAALLLVALERLRSLVFDDALAASRFAAPMPVLVGTVLALLIALVLHRGCAAYWVARRAALHNAGSTRLESP
jgi:hypothetical protein